MNIDINVTQEQLSLIYDALETYYYICKNESDKERVEDILRLQTSLYKQKANQTLHK